MGRILASEVGDGRMNTMMKGRERRHKFGVERVGMLQKMKPCCREYDRGI